jgi:hypothetical protein
MKRIGKARPEPDLSEIEGGAPGIEKKEQGRRLRLRGRGKGRIR